MKQKLILLTLVIGLTIVSQSTFSLGMGNIQVYSSLDEQLRSTIELTSGSDENLEGLSVKLASTEDYKKVGLDKSFVPSNIKVSLSDDDPNIINVTSNGPVSEPIVSVLLDVNWNNGRILREFTILLDPAVYDVNTPDSQVNNVVVEAIQDDSSYDADSVVDEEETTNKVYTNEDVSQYARDTSTETTETVEAEVMDEEDSYTAESYASEVYVNAGDTLWRIANQNKLGGLSTNQMMIAIYNNNSAAFIDNNINRLIKGSKLSMPSMAEAEAISYAEALAEVRSHNQSWSAQDSDYSSYQTEDSYDDDYQDDTSSLDYGVQLSGGDSDGSDSGQTNAEATGDDSGQLSAEDEYNQASENEDLQERITELEDIVEQQQAAIEITDDSMSNLESQLSEVNDDTAVDDESLAAVTDEMTDDVWDTSIDDGSDDLSDNSVAESLTDETMLTDDMDDVDESTAVDDGTETAMTDSVEDNAKDSSTGAVAKTTVKTKQEESFIDQSINWVMANLMWVLIGLGALVLLLVVPRFLRSSEVEEDETSFLDDIKQRNREKAEAAEVDEDAAETKMNNPLGSEDHTDTAAHEALEDDPFDSDTDDEDVLAELDKSITFDETDQDEDSEDDDDLFDNDDNEPVDSDDFDLDGFLNDDLDDDMSVTADHSDTMKQAQVEPESESDEFDVDLDDLDDLDLDEDDANKAEANEISEISEEIAADDMDDFDLDDEFGDLDLDDIEEEQAPSDDQVVEETSEDDDLDLDDDFDFDLDEELDNLETDEVSEENQSVNKKDESSVTDDSEDDFDDLLDLSDEEDETFDIDTGDEMDEEIDLGLEGLLDEGDAIDTKLDLAKAYLEMGDVDGAKNLLEEVVSEGSGDQVETAKKLLDDM